MNQTDEQEIYAIIAKHCAADGPAILPTSTLKDLGIDSLGAIEIIFDLEEHFNVTLPDRDPKFDAGSVQGLVDSFASALATKADSALPQS